MYGLMTLRNHFARVKPGAWVRHQVDGWRGRYNDDHIGCLFRGKGVLLAYGFQHTNEDGRPVGPRLNYFAAPDDTAFLDGSNAFETYARDLERIAAFRDVCGHNGILFKNANTIYEAAEHAPEKLAFWHMPPSELVDGRYACDLKRRNHHNMSSQRDVNRFKDGFAASPVFYHHCYWTASEYTAFAHYVRAVDFVLGEMNYYAKDFDVWSSRAVRAEICPHL